MKIFSITKISFLSSFIIYFAINIEHSYAGTVSVIDQSVFLGNISTTQSNSINTYDANGSPCTISNSTNCGAYFGFGAVGGHLALPALVPHIFPHFHVNHPQVIANFIL
jgi:hypothetical protein